MMENGNVISEGASTIDPPIQFNKNDCLQESVKARVLRDNLDFSHEKSEDDLNLNISPNPLDCHQTIMSACSSVGQHIRQNITEALKYRINEETSSSDSNVLLPSSVLENFENALKENLAPTRHPITFDATAIGEGEPTSARVPTDEKADNFTQLSNTNMPSCQDFNATVTEVDANTNHNDVNSKIESLESNSHHQSDADDKTESLESIYQNLCEDILQTINGSINLAINNEKIQTSSENMLSLITSSVTEKLNDSKPLVLDNWAKVITEITEREKSCEDHFSPNEMSPLKDIDDEKSAENTKGNEESQQSNAVEVCASCSNVVGDKDRSTKKTQKVSGNKKKGDKTIGFLTNQILKSLSTIPSDDEKLNVLCRKHAESLEKVKATEHCLNFSERKVIQLTKEKEQLQADHNRNLLAKSRLESLCRELQRHNKAVKEESLLRIREEEKRKEVASKFQTTLSDISTLMQENSKKNLQLKEENTELAQKLKQLVEHYEMWEKHMEKVVQQKDLECQLAKVKNAKLNLQLKQETENFLREKQSLLENLSELQKKCTQMASNELHLRSELGDYTMKYEEFQTVLTKSNQVFASFKTDMDSTTKKIKKLEKETTTWKLKFESSNKALLEMITDKQVRDKEFVNFQQRILTLEKLCRALQAERNDLQNQLKTLTENLAALPSDWFENKVCTDEVSESNEGQ